MLQALQPNLAKQIPASKSVELVDGDLPAPVADLVRLAEAVRWLPIVALVIALMCAYGAVRLAGDGRDAVLVVGLAITLVAILANVGLRAVEAVILTGIDDQAGRDAVSGIWDAFLGDLGTALLLLAVCGGVIAAAASSLLRPVDLRAEVARVWELATRVPESRGGARYGPSCSSRPAS